MDFREVEEKSQRIIELINTTISIGNDLLTEKNYSDSIYVEKIINNLGTLSVDNTQSMRIGEYDLPVLYAGKERSSLDIKLVDNIKEFTGTITSIFLLNIIS